MATQTERRSELHRILSKLKDSQRRDILLQRFDQIVTDAAAVHELRTPEQAVASLEIAICAMGGDPKHPEPCERLIQLTIAFLKTMTCIGVGLAAGAPCIIECGLAPIA